ncbi:MAG TPA: hypothetical protein VFO12_06510, partial [Sphingomicrobium sp.]|nr:hypothetical protein [Sphingomicrobium sp.]
LNAPAAVPRPDGVIRAGNIEIDFEGAESATLYVQNTGTADTPAGFLVTEQVFLGEDEELEMPPGSIDLIINGQIIQDGETLTGIDVRDAMVADQGDLTAFTENSTINGCLLAGACTDPGPPDPPLPPDFTPTPGIQDEVTLIDDDILPPPEFGNEDVIDDNDEETEDDSPIQPPNPLFDTSDLSEEGGTVAPEIGTPMRSTPGLTDTGDVDDPVSGTGNPALMETTPQTKEEQQQ